MDFGAIKIDRNTLTNATNSLPGIADTLANLGIDKAKELMAQVNLLLRLLQSAGYGVCALATELALSPKITMTLKASPILINIYVHLLILPELSKSRPTTLWSATSAPHPAR